MEARIVLSPRFSCFATAGGAGCLDVGQIAAWFVLVAHGLDIYGGEAVGENDQVLLRH